MRKLKKTPSPKSLIVRSRVVHDAVALMLRSWAAKTTAAMGSKQLAQHSDGKYGSEDGTGGKKFTVEDWDGEIPSWNGGEVESIPVTRDVLFKGVMTLQAAFDTVDDAAKDALARFTAITTTQNVRMRTKGRVLSWRKWVSVPMATRIMAIERLMCRTAIQATTLRKVRRVGRQRISVRSKQALPVGQFLFGGRAAVRMPRGRPPLPEHEWRARYFARAVKRRKKNATQYRRNRGLVKLPDTKTERPKVAVKLGP